MTLVDLVVLLKQTGYPVAYSHFTDTEFRPAPAPPFICYTTPDTSNFFADNKVHLRLENVNIELYTDKKDPLAEQTLEDLLDQYGIPYDCIQTFIQGEGLFQKLYEIGVI